MAGDLTLNSLNNSSTDSSALVPPLQDEGHQVPHKEKEKVKVKEDIQPEQSAHAEPAANELAPAASESVASPESSEGRQGAASEPTYNEAQPATRPELELELELELEAEAEPSENLRKIQIKEQQQLERYLDQITRVFENHQQRLTISRNDNALLADELSQLKSQYDNRIADIEKQNRDHIEVITAQLDSLKGENNRLNHDLASKDIENALLAKNFQLQEDNLSHVKKELAEASVEGAKQQIEELTAEKGELKDMTARLEAELKELHSERAALQKDLDDEADQKNALISRFRAEIATLEEKHALQLERQALELERKLLNKEQE